LITGHLARPEIRLQPQRLQRDGLAVGGLILGPTAVVLAGPAGLPLWWFFSRPPRRLPPPPRGRAPPRPRRPSPAPSPRPPAPPSSGGTALPTCSYCSTRDPQKT
ncbi:hypothetical protein DYQ93_21780, partial [Xanthomonas sp. LMG 8992]|nr:hypothetical protein [Xanthomonas sp. LMG 8992]